jgi:serine/threonine-protein kinase
MAALGKIDIYEVHEELGSGGMATVYRALATQDRDEIGIKVGSEVAIKVLHSHLAKIPEFPRRFAREARVAAKLTRFPLPEGDGNVSG